MSNTTYVSTGKPKVAGAVFRAPIGTALPTSAGASLAAGFVELGYVSDDGVTNSNAPETSNVKAWGGQIVLILQTEKKDEWKLKLLEALNPNVLDAVYGSGHVAYNASAGTINVEATADQLSDACYVIDMVLKGGALKRVVIPCGAISSMADIIYKDDEPIGYELTISALPDEDAVNHYEYIVLANSANAGITLDKSTLSVAKNASAAIVATTTPAGGRVLWGTSDPKKATVDANGNVTGVAAGSAVITAYYGGVTATCNVTVTA